MSGMFPDFGVPPGEANNSLPDPDTENCQELWYSTSRCAPRFDPAAANAVLAELLNLVNGCGTVYDCDKLDNVHTAVMNCIWEALFGCLPRDFPPATGCTLQNMVISTDANGCKRIALYDDTSAGLGYADTKSVYGPVHALSIPPNPTDTNTFYTLGQLALDIRNGTLNMTKLNNNKILRIEFTLECATLVALHFQGAVTFNPALNCQSSIFYMVDNTAVVSPLSGFPDHSGPFTNYVASFVYDHRISIAAPGWHYVDYFLISEGGACVSLPIVGSPGSSSHLCTARRDIL